MNYYGFKRIYINFSRTFGSCVECYIHIGLVRKTLRSICKIHKIRKIVRLRGKFFTGNGGDDGLVISVNPVRVKDGPFSPEVNSKAIVTAGEYTAVKQTN